MNRVRVKNSLCFFYNSSTAQASLFAIIKLSSSSRSLDSRSAIITEPRNIYIIKTVFPKKSVNIIVLLLQNVITNKRCLFDEALIKSRRSRYRDQPKSRFVAVYTHTDIAITYRKNEFFCFQLAQPYRIGVFVYVSKEHYFNTFYHFNSKLCTHTPAA